MEKTTSMSCTFGRTIKTGNYESARIDVTEEVNVKGLADDELEDAWSRLRLRVSKRLRAMADNV
mgnify:FL=1|jgi:hypothetical protein